MSRNASGIAVVAVLLCLPLLAQAPANNGDAEREADDAEAKNKATQKEILTRRCASKIVVGR